MAAFVKVIAPAPPALSAGAMNCCTIPELLVTPTPLKFSDKVAGTVNAKALAAGLNTIPFTSTVAENETSVVFEVANVAVSDGPLGTVSGVQLVAVFQSPLVGFSFPSRAVGECGLKDEE